LDRYSTLVEKFEHVTRSLLRELLIRLADKGSPPRRSATDGEADQESPPAVDCAKGAPSVFDSCDEEAGVPAPVSAMTLESSEVLEGGGVWLRYRLQSG
jgi:hypothetical protein